MLTQERVMEILKEAGVLLEGHFRLTSGKHSNKYLQCAKIFRNTKYSEELCAALAEEFKDEGVEVVIGPALGAVQMTYEVSRWLKCENFFAERDDGKMTLRRGFEFRPGQKVLVVEDGHHRRFRSRSHGDCEGAGRRYCWRWCDCGSYCRQGGFWCAV